MPSIGVFYRFSLDLRENDWNKIGQFGLIIDDGSEGYTINLDYISLTRQGPISYDVEMKRGVYRFSPNSTSGVVEYGDTADMLDDFVASALEASEINRYTGEER